MHALSIDLISIACDLDARHEFAFYSTQFHFAVLTLAYICLFRISRSDIAEHVNAQAGEVAAREALKLFQKRSITKSDLNSRTVAIFARLWSSQKVFKTRNGRVDPLKVRLCGRLV